MKVLHTAVRPAAAPIAAKSKKATSVKEKPMKVKATKKVGAKEPKAKRAPKDPNEPKKPQTAFFLFMASFRPSCGLKGAAAAKAGGETWKGMSDEAKKPFVDEANTRKAEYAKVMAAYKCEKMTMESSSGDSKTTSEITTDEVDMLDME